MNKAKATGFEAWKILVNEKVWRRIGCGIDDLPDAPLHDWYEDGLSAGSAAARAIRNAKEG